MINAARKVVSFLWAFIWGQPFIWRMTIGPDARDEFDVALTEDKASGAASNADNRQQRVVDLWVPERFMLVRSLKFPNLKLSDVKKAAEIDLFRRTPFRADDVIWTWSVDAAPSGGRAVRQWTMKRSEAERLVSALSERGYQVRRLNVAGESTEKPLWDRSQDVVPSSFRVGLLNGSFALATVGLLLWAFVAPAFDAERDLEFMRGEIQARTLQAVELRRQILAQQEMATERSAVESVVAQRTRTTSALERVTRMLPGTTWASALEVRDNLVTASVTSDISAAELVLSLGATEDVQQAQIVGPIARLPGGAERFDLEVTLLGGHP